MRKIEAPDVDDLAVLDLLYESGGKNAVAIRPFMDEMRGRYNEYHIGGGNSWNVLMVDTFDAVKGNLYDLYDDDLLALSHISLIRNSLKGACPVCGRDGLGTLDHHLPRSLYQEFSIFSKNLVPACSRCNGGKGVEFRGAGAARAFHPYYDEFGVGRVVTIEFAPPWEVPRLRMVPFEVAGDYFDIVSWQIANVIEPSGLGGYLDGLWSSVVDGVSDFIGDDGSIADCRRELVRQVRIEDRVANSKNSWRSAFFHGLSNCDGAIAYLSDLR